MTRVGRWILLIALAGDTLLLLAFAAIGRSSHHESRGPAKILSTALPFLAGWFIAACAFSTYQPAAFQTWLRAAARAAGTALGGILLALAIRSILEHRIVPLPFVVVALLFNGITLTLWHTLLGWATRRTA